MQDAGSIGAGSAQVLAAWQGKLLGVAGDLITSSIVTTGEPESGVLQSYSGKGIVGVLRLSANTLLLRLIMTFTDQRTMALRFLHR